MQKSRNRTGRRTLRQLHAQVANSLTLSFTSERYEAVPVLMIRAWRKYSFSMPSERTSGGTIHRSSVRRPQNGLPIGTPVDISKFIIVFAVIGNDGILSPRELLVLSE